VRHLSSVKLTEGFLGIWGSCLPQYLTNAMLLGADQWAV